MAALVNILGIDASGQLLLIFFNVVLSGNYPTGGDVLNFAAAGQDPAFVGLLASVESQTILQCDVWSQGRGFVNGANTTNYAVSVTKSGSPATINPATGVKLVAGVLNTYGTEHSAGAYEAAYTADLITGFAVAAKL